MSGVLPQGACDCHCHVFGPAARFPYAEPRSYTPDDAPLEAYLALLDRLGFDHGVLVQPSAYGRDNRAMLDALTRAPTRLRGVAVGGAELDTLTLSYGMRPECVACAPMNSGAMENRITRMV